MNNKKVNGDLCHDLLIKNIEPKLAYNPSCNYDEWRKKVKAQLWELLGMDNIVANACEPNFCIEQQEQKQGYNKIRFSFESEHGEIVPVYVLIPDTNQKKYPVVITLQGHSTGFHNSIGEPKSKDDEEYAFGRGAFAVQAVKRGYVAVAIEQRYMGERKTARECGMCTFGAMTALQLGRTTIGERVWDVSKTIDLLSNIEQANLNDITITGNSGGGTISYYAACMDERIKLSVPSCAFCTYEESIFNVFHCPCNYIPSMSLFFEMQDLSCLIAPRKLCIVSGKEDEIFRIEGVRKGYETVKNIYSLINKKDYCRLVETPKGHWWCEDIVWNNIDDMRKTK